MSSLIKLFYETNSSRLVKGIDDPADASLRPFFQEDTLPIDLAILSEVPGAAEPPFFSRLSTTGYSLYISVGVAGNVYADQAAWATDAGNTVFSGFIDLNQPDMNSLPDGSIVKLEIRLFDGARYLRGQFETTFHKSVATGAVVADPPGDVALGVKEADQVYAKKIRKPGEYDIYVSENGLFRRVVGCDNRGNYVNRRERVPV